MAEQYPFVEWGILYSQTRRGEGRYPSFRWINRLVERMGNIRSPNFALHVCGRAVNFLLSGSDVNDVSRTARAFKRVQINFNSSRYSLTEIRRFVIDHPLQTVITQNNSANEFLWRSLIDTPNHAVLFDASGGRGIERTKWPEPLSMVGSLPPSCVVMDPVCGYAGGLGPDNLAVQLPAIHAAASGRPYWVDMEGKLRDNNDRFDLSRAEECLKLARKFIEISKLA